MCPATNEPSVSSTARACGESASPHEAMPMPEFELEGPDEAPAVSKCRVLEFKPSRLDGQDPVDEPEPKN